jgi:hypothetical protein
MLYFAYGSNMATPRLGARLDRVEFVDVATLRGHRLAFHMAGDDGSAKCAAFYTGVVFGIVARVQRRLDSIEGLGVGYAQKQVRVTARQGGRLEAFTYCAMRIADGLRPFAWYRGHVLHGAGEHGLPADYIRGIEAVEAVADPDAGRHAAEMAIYDSRVVA